MSIKLSTILAAAFLGCLVVGSTFAWSNVPRPVPGQTVIAKTDVTRPLPGALSPPAASRPAITLETPAPVRVATAAAPAPEVAPAFRTKPDFNQAFADVTGAPRPENTPAYREKLRQIGWKRITAR